MGRKLEVGLVTGVVEFFRVPGGVSKGAVYVTLGIVYCTRTGEGGGGGVRGEVGSGVCMW